jgi:myo-inositol-1(or 4)-monophosphatase
MIQGNTAPPEAEQAPIASIVPQVVNVVHAAGHRLLATFSPAARPRDRGEMSAALSRNEAASLAGLREGLAAIRPGARWVEEEQESMRLPPGEWWAVDAVEGNVNHVHGMSEWCVSLALLRNNAPILAVVYQPIGDATYVAVRGGGARVNGASLRVSPKTALGAAIVATGQAQAGLAHTHGRMGQSITAMLGHALLVRAAVPSTFPMLLVASGQNDIFWQYAPVLSGVAAGILLVVEAGGVVSRVDGSPWLPGSDDILLATPALHAPTVSVLSKL